MHTGTYFPRDEESVTLAKQAPAAVTPTEAAKLNDAKHVAEFHAAVIRINERLKSQFTTGGSVQISDSWVGSDKVASMVISHFKAAGWRIDRKEVPDPREPYSYYVFSA